MDEHNIDVRTDFIDIYSRDILEALGVKDESEEGKKLLEMINNRVTARLYLEMVSMLTPEQAAMVSADANSESADPEKVLRETIEKIPDFGPRLALVLGKIRSELIEDLKPLLK